MSIQIADVMGVWRLRAAVAGCVAVAVGLAITSMVWADSPPLGKCYGGALSSEPLHCYILEQAETDRVLAVEAVYRSGRSLYVYISQKGDMTKEITGYLREKTGEFYDRWPGSAPDGSRYVRCRRFDNSHRECLMDHQSWTGGVDYVFLPWPAGYTAVGVFAGGAEARKSRRGWPSWSQLWPLEEESDGKPGDLVGKFDVSELDLNTEREVDCRLWPTGSFCGAWKKYPGSGITGWYSVPYEEENTAKIHLQAKVPPADQEQLEAVKEALATDDYDPSIKYEVVVIPVKYDYGEMWRWAEILQRFAATSGNTIGIITARVSSNSISGHREVVWPLKDFLRPSDSAGAYDEFRQTVRIVANDPQRVAAALPVLLPQLGIPVDAVGMVILSEWEEHVTAMLTTDVGRERPLPKLPNIPGFQVESGGAGASGSVEVGSGGVGASGSGVGMVTVALAGGAVAVVVLGAAVFAAARLRRRG